MPPPLRRAIPNVRRVLAVASGKGGVGKSTISASIASHLLLRRPSSRVGILDLDIFGPSIPRLLGLSHWRSADPTEVIRNHGLHVQSIGFMVEEGGAVVWRGLMVQKAAQQLLFDTKWPELDYLVLDLPPGTGDVPLTLGQLVKVDGALVVSTPQDVALADVRRGVRMFSQISVPLLGLVLNQAYYTCSSCSTRHELWGSPEKCRAAATEFGTSVLAELPLISGVSEYADKGMPYALTKESNRDWIKAMDTLTDSIIHKLA